MTDTQQDQPLLIAEGLTKRYGRQIGCRDVSFELYEGEVIAVVITIGGMLGATFVDVFIVPVTFSIAPSWKAPRLGRVAELQKGISARLAFSRICSYCPPRKK